MDPQEERSWFHTLNRKLDWIAVGIWILVFYFAGQRLLDITGEAIGFVFGTALTAFHWLMSQWVATLVVLLSIVLAVLAGLVLNKRDQRRRENKRKDLGYH